MTPGRVLRLLVAATVLLAVYEAGRAPVVAATASRTLFVSDRDGTDVQGCGMNASAPCRTIAFTLQDGRPMTGLAQVVLAPGAYVAADLPWIDGVTFAAAGSAADTFVGCGLGHTTTATSIMQPFLANATHATSVRWQGVAFIDCTAVFGNIGAYVSASFESCTFNSSLALIGSAGLMADVAFSHSEFEFGASDGARLAPLSISPGANVRLSTCTIRGTILSVPFIDAHAGSHIDIAHPSHVVVDGVSAVGCVWKTLLGVAVPAVVNISNSVMSDCIATSAPLLDVSVPASAATVASLTNTTVQRCHGSDVGAVSVQAGTNALARVSLGASRFIENSGNAAGAVRIGTITTDLASAIASPSVVAVVEVQGCHFEGNTALGADGVGGAMLAAGTSLAVRSSNFTHNIAARAGGLAIVGAGTATVTDTSFTANSALNSTIPSVAARFCWLVVVVVLFRFCSVLWWVSVG